MSENKEELQGDEAPSAGVVTPPATAEPSAQRRTRSKSSGTRSRARSLPTLEERLTDFFGQMKQNEDSGVWYCTGIAGLGWIYNQQDGFLIAQHSGNMAKAWANLAAQNERVARMLELLLSGGAWGEVFFATSPVVLGILANHGIGLASFGMGTPSADAESADGTGGDTTEDVGRVPPSVSV